MTTLNSRLKRAVDMFKSMDDFVLMILIAAFLALVLGEIDDYLSR